MQISAGSGFLPICLIFLPRGQKRDINSVQDLAPGLRVANDIPGHNN